MCSQLIVVYQTVRDSNFFALFTVEYQEKKAEVICIQTQLTGNSIFQESKYFFSKKKKKK